MAQTPLPPCHKLSQVILVALPPLVRTQLANGRISKCGKLKYVNIVMLTLYYSECASTI